MGTKRHRSEGRIRIRYGSHLPMLTKYLWEMAKYPRDRVLYVIEHGCGNYSTPVISHFCTELEVEHVTVEMDSKYRLSAAKRQNFTNLWSFERWLTTIADDGHFPRDCIGLALIDGEQHDRKKMIELCSKALFLVVHDTEMLSLYDYDLSRFDVIDETPNLVPETKVLQLK